MHDTTLMRPTGLQDETWAAVEAARARLVRALDAKDDSQSVGCAKELVESIAKVVLVERSEAVEGNVAFQSVVSRAHAALNRQPGEGLSTNGTLRNIASGAKTIATQLGELRNELGSGHGRAYEPVVTPEDVDLAVGAALLWSRWALRRLEQLIYGALPSLITDLASANFRAGLLATRLLAAGLPELDRADQHRLGVAVGQRAMGETFLVQIEGVQACAEGDLATWPVGYRRGVIEGLFINREGYATATAWSAAIAARVIAPIPGAGAALTELVQRVTDAPLHQRRWAWPMQHEVHAALTGAAGLLPLEFRAAWKHLAAAFEPEAPS